ncbi:MAG: tyrosine-type recombinase/integrase [Desulfobacter sp.]|nr:MAG: tyrosine-type recombinase/integrase [Desulfobacter sp.]
MKKKQNFNHPKAGSRIAVEPIRSTKDIKAIKKLLADKPRDLCLFTLGINTNLRASDLLRIKVNRVSHLKPGDELDLKEKKTGKARKITINKTVHEAISRLLEFAEPDMEDYLFSSQRGDVLTVPSLSRLVKNWCKMINLKGNYASHTLRKTWGYHQRVSFNVGIPELMVCFNHSTQRQTLDYLCIQPEEIKSVYLNEL